MRPAFVVILVLAGCGRSGLSVPDDELIPGDPFDPSDPDEPDPLPEEDPCEPSEEVCNGVDDDCDEQVDEGQPAVACENGGDSYCVNGTYSECPRACQTCQPNSQRVCFVSYCTIWGEQRCDSDGRAWENCREDPPPAACRSDENGFGGAADGPETEECCIEQGFCCEDYWDLDDDGDTDEMVGACDGVSCGD